MPPAPSLPLNDRIQRIKERIEIAAQRSQRPASAIELIAVTKTISASIINEAIQCGLTVLGENRIQEAQAKRSDLKGDLTHHLLGSLQTNKARKAVELFDVIQSVDRPRLADVLNRVAGEVGKKQDCLVEVKISKEDSKSGVDVKDVASFVQNFHQYSNLNLTGLMTIAPFDVPEAETRMCFGEMKKIFDGLKDHFGPCPILSMGMTDDFEIAVEEGSTMVRIGRAIFGERPA